VKKKERWIMKRKFFSLLSIILIFSIIAPLSIATQNVNAYDLAKDDAEVIQNTSTDRLIDTVRQYNANYSGNPKEEKNENKPTATNVIYLPLILRNPSWAIIPDTTKVLTSETLEYLESISNDGKTFTFSQTTGDLSDVREGEVIVGDVNAASQNGFLRKVTSITNDGSKIVVETEDASLDDAIQDGNINIEFELSPDDIQDSMMMDGVSLQKSPKAISGAQFEYSIDDVVLYDDDGDLDTEDDQVVAKGNLKYTIEPDVDIKIRDFNQKYMKFAVKSTETSTIEIESEVQESIQKRIEIASHTLAPITIPIGLGLFPIVFTPKISVYVGANGEVHVGVSAGATQETTSTSGLKIENGTWSPINEFSNDFTFSPPTLSAGLDVKGYSGLSLSMLVYGVVGPHADITLYLLLEANPLETPWWNLFAGLDITIGVKLEIFTIKIQAYEKKVIEYKELIASAPTNPAGEMVPIPEGNFWMGCDPNHNGGYSCYSETLPLHQVYLDAYSIDKYEVTNDQMAAFLNSRGGNDCDGYKCVDLGDSDLRISYIGGKYVVDSGYGDHPVVEVSWYGANAYCAENGKRLPTEAEWEKAARGTTVRAYSWGDNAPTCALANFWPSGGACIGDTAPVGSYPLGASPYGVLDMAGNVLEWVNDWYSSTYYSSSPPSNPMGPDGGEGYYYRVMRGGAWDFSADQMLVALRNRHLNYFTESCFGFRCVQSP
jgi:formylglycine-generating enzyme